MTSLIGYAELLARHTHVGNPLSERDWRAVHTIQEQAARLETMLTSVLDTARLAAAEMHM